MRAIRNIFMLLSMTILLSGCSLDYKRVIEVKGYSLEEMDLHIMKKDDMSFRDPNLLYKITPGFGIVHNMRLVNSPIEEYYSINGNLSIIYVYYRDSNNEIYTLPFKYIQGFKKSEINAENHYAVINSKHYSSSDLTEHIQYEDNQWIVYEISDYLGVLQRYDKLKMLENQVESSYDYNWLIIPNYYLDNHLKELITKDQNNQLQYIQNEHYIIVNGFSLHEMGLNINEDQEERRFQDPNHDYPTTTNFIYHHSNVTQYYSSEYINLHGSYSLIDVAFNHGGLDLEQIPAKYVQGFRKEDVLRNEDFVQINSRLYRFNDLAPSKIYEDNRWVVYELSNYLNVLDFEKKLKNYSDNSPFNYNYSWLKEVYRYLDQHLAVMISE